ncbi:MAG TPA: TIGR02281 family clan AA aspartic protease [Alphaproteobacteria bacterium]|nr:TIGR02281 family clan AA aspartic protease [Alphaproteobacteria bacterium]
MSNRLGGVALLLIAIAGGLFLLFQQFPGVIGGQFEQARLAQGVLLLVLVASSFVMGWTGSAGAALKQALLWAGLFVIMLTVYAYRTEFLEMGFRVAGVTMPTIPMAGRPTDNGSGKSATGVVYLRAVERGHFLADAAVNGTHVRFLVDTGASIVGLSASDAQRLGMDLKKLNFDITVSTANGETKAARVTLDEIKIGSISRKKVDALIARDGEMSISLLGMSFLNSLGSFEMGDGVLILRD